MVDKNKLQEKKVIQYRKQNDLMQIEATNLVKELEGRGWVVERIQKITEDTPIKDGKITIEINVKGIRQWYRENFEKITVYDKIESQYMNLNRKTGEVELVYKVLEQHDTFVPRKSKCVDCGKMFQGTGMFCSQKCEKAYEKYVFGDN